MTMTKTVGVTLGGYGVVAFAIGLFDLVRNLEDGLPRYEAFTDSFWTGISWPVSLVAFIWS